MVTIKDETRQLIYNGSAEYLVYLHIGDTLVDVSNIKTITISDAVTDSETDYFYIGTFASRKLEVQFQKEDTYDLTKEITLQIGVKDFDDESILDVVDYGSFYVDTSDSGYWKDAKLTAYDYAIKMKTAFNPEPYFNHDEKGVATYINIVTLLQTICNYYGVELGTYPNVNNNLNIYAYDSTLSGKRQTSYIAELMGGNVKIGRNKKLNIVPIKSTPVIDIGITQGESFTIGEKFKISKVTFQNGVVNPSTYGDDTGNTVYIRSENIFLSGDDDTRNTIVQNIYNAVEGLEIYSLETTMPTDISIEATDIVNYVDDDGTKYPTYYNITNNVGTKGTVKTSLPTKSQEENTNTNENTDDVGKARQIKTYIDQQNAEFRLEVENTYGERLSELENWKNSLVIKDTYTKDEIKQIIHGVGVDGEVVTSTITESGTFDKDGLTIDNDTGKYKGNFNQNGMKVVEKSTDNTVLYAGADEDTGESVVKSMNINVSKYLQIGSYTRMQDFTMEDESGVSYDVTGVFWLK